MVSRILHESEAHLMPPFLYAALISTSCSGLCCQNVSYSHASEYAFPSPARLFGPSLPS